MRGVLVIETRSPCFSRYHLREPGLAVRPRACVRYHLHVRRGEQAEGTSGESMGGAQADVAFRVRDDDRSCWARDHDRAYDGDLRDEAP